MQVTSDKIVEIESAKEIRDNGGRRLGIERRSYSYSLHIPERRDGKDRRSGMGRRKIKRDLVVNWTK